jgi:hypothetical protein
MLLSGQLVFNDDCEWSLSEVPRKCAFLTMDSLEDFFAYDHMAHRPLAQLGWQVDDVSWRREDVCWDDYEIVVIRSPWDYQSDPQKFIDVLKEIDRSRARLENSLQTVLWNIDKTYLRDLESRGVTIVPATWCSPLTSQGLEKAFTEFRVDQIVVKPTVGANADDTFWLRSDSADDQFDRVVKTFVQRSALVQPFMQSVIDEGEYSLFYFGNAYSHCILKSPKSGDFRVQEEHGGAIRSYEPQQDLLVAGRRAIEAIEQDTLYARVDLVRLPDGRPAVMELELIEPSLYFPFDAGSPSRFAQALNELF